MKKNLLALYLLLSTPVFAMDMGDESQRNPSNTAAPTSQVPLGLRDWSKIVVPDTATSKQTVEELTKPEIAEENKKLKSAITAEENEAFNKKVNFLAKTLEFQEIVPQLTPITRNIAETFEAVSVNVIQSVPWQELGDDFMSSNKIQGVIAKISEAIQSTGLLDGAYEKDILPYLDKMLSGFSKKIKL